MVPSHAKITAYRESLALREKLMASGDKTVDASTLAMTLNGVGGFLSRADKLSEGEALIRRSIAIRRRIGDTGYAYADSLIHLGAVVAKENRLAEAEALDREGLASLRTFVEPDDHRIVEATQQLADVRRAQVKR